jgi:hypothetical protein
MFELNSGAAQGQGGFGRFSVSNRRVLFSLVRTCLGTDIRLGDVGDRGRGLNNAIKAFFGKLKL